MHLNDSATKLRLILADYEHEPPGPNTRYLKAGQKVCGISICGVQANSHDLVVLLQDDVKLFDFYSHPHI